MKRRHFMVLLSMLLTVCLWQGRVNAVDFASEPLSAVDSGYEIVIQQSAGENYLLLPADAQYSQLTLKGACTLTGDNGAEIVLSGAEGGETVDLTTLFSEEMIPGTAYTLTVMGGPEDSAPAAVKLIKGDGISTIFVTGDTDISVLHETKDNSAKGELMMVKADGSQVNENTKLKKFKGRGNSSWYNSGEKRPYNLTLDKKAELIEGAGAAKKWCLISDNVYDREPGSILANAAAYHMYQSIDGASPMDYEFVNLYYNGEYRGVYLLTEKVEIGKARVDIGESDYAVEDEDSKTLVVKDGTVDPYPLGWGNMDLTNAVTADESDPAIAAGIQAYSYATNSQLEPDSTEGGFLLELDIFWYQAEASWFVTRRGTAYVFKEPEFATKEQVQTAAIHMQAVEDAIYSETGYNDQGKYYTDYIDLEAMAKKVIIDLAANQRDTFRSSCYFHMTRNSDEIGIVYAGPAWDYDGSLYSQTGVLPGNWEADSGDGSADARELVHALYQHGDFAAVINELSLGTFRDVWWQEKEETLWQNIALLTPNYQMNTVLWNADGSNSAPGDFMAFANNFYDRYNYWYSSVYADSALRAATAAETEPGVLTADVTGTAAAYQWMVLKDGQLKPVKDGNTAAYAPDRSGVYYCLVSGQSMDGLGVSEMYTNPVSVTIVNPFGDVKEGDYFYDSVLWAVDHEITDGVKKGVFAADHDCTRGQIVTLLWRAVGSPAPKNTVNPFTDVPDGQYYYDAVLWAVENGITTGTAATRFSPNAICTRAQIVTFLWRYLGEPQAQVQTASFTDLKETEYYYPAVLWAVENGVTDGVAAGRFAPEHMCTRGQSVTFLYRSRSWLGYDLKAE